MVEQSISYLESTKRVNITTEVNLSLHLEFTYWYYTLGLRG